MTVGGVGENVGTMVVAIVVVVVVVVVVDTVDEVVNIVPGGSVINRKKPE